MFLSAVLRRLKNPEVLQLPQGLGYPYLPFSFSRIQFIVIPFRFGVGLAKNRLYLVDTLDMAV